MTYPLTLSTISYIRTTIVTNNINLTYWHSFRFFFFYLNQFSGSKPLFKFYFVWETKRPVLLVKTNRSQNLSLNTQLRASWGGFLAVRYLLTLSSTFLRNSLNQNTTTPLLVFSLNFWNFFNKFLWFSTYYYLNFMVTYSTRCLYLSSSFFCELPSISWSSQILRYL